MDLPTIVESFKTVDKKSFYKTADVCQVLCMKYFYSAYYVSNLFK